MTDSNPRCTHGRENVGQSDYMPEPTCASPEDGSSNREAQAIVTWLEPPVLPGTPVKKKSRILSNEAKEKRLMELYEHSSSDPSRGCTRRLLELWTLNFPEYSTTSNALMKRVRLIKSRPVTMQTSSSGSEATAEVEESSLPNPPVSRRTIETGGGEIPTSQLQRWGRVGTHQGRNQCPRVSQRRNPWIPTPIWMRKVEHHYHQLLTETNLRGKRSTKWPGVHVDSRQHAAINQWMRGVKPPKHPGKLTARCMLQLQSCDPRNLPSLRRRHKGKKRSACASGDS